MLLLGGTRIHAQDPLVVTVESPIFTIDTRMPPDNPVETGLVVQVESPAFTIDTRMSPDNPVETGLVVQVESPAFTIDTRMSPDNPVETGLVVQVESATFTIDTRITTVAAPEGFTVVEESGAFTLDTRIVAENPLEGGQVTRAESAPFTVDLRITSDDFNDSDLVTRAESNLFTIDTQSGWIKAPFRDLAGPDSGGGTGGKMRFSPDGMRLAKADGGRVVLWNLQSPKPGVAMASGGGSVASVEFSPPGDQILTATTDGTARWWDAASREEAGSVTPGDGKTAYAAYSADGSRVLAGGGTKVGLYRMPGRELVREFDGLDTPLTALALAPDGLFAMAATSDRVLTVWDTASGERLHGLTGNTHLITAAAFLSNGTRAMSASLDGTIRVWDLTSGQLAFTIQQGGQVADAALSAAGTLIASCNTATPGTAYVWDARDGALLRVFSDTTLEPSPMTGVAISPDHTMLVTSHADGRTRVWDTGLTPQPMQSVTTLALGTTAPVTLRSHGLYYFEVDAPAGRSLVVTLEAANNALQAMSLRTPTKGGDKSATGISANAQFANLTESPSGLKIMTVQSLQKPPPTADITAFRMTSMRGRLPSAYDYEIFAQAPVSNLHCEMPLALTGTGKAYVLVYAPYLSAGTIAATLHAEYADFHLSDISPARGGNSGNVTARIQGTGITPDTTARLVGTGGSTAVGQLALWGDSTKAWFTFPLANLAPGFYQVELGKPGVTPVVLANAFQVVAAVGPQLQSSLTAPSSVRPGRDYGMTLKYANTGDVDMAAPLFVIAAGDSRPSIYSMPRINALVVTQTSGAPSTARMPQIQILGVNQDGPPGILPPGASWEIPLYFQGDGSVFDMAFNLSVLKADATPIDWAALRPYFKGAVVPAKMSSDLWVPVWSNFRTTMGATWADWLHALDNQAHQMALAGQSCSNPADLLAALFSQAVNTPYRRTLAAAVDAQAPAPGLPLTFSRFATSGLEQRFRVGPLGRGWSHNFEYSLHLASRVFWDGWDPETGQPAGGSYETETEIRTPGGGTRRFTFEAGGFWKGIAGDDAILEQGPGYDAKNNIIYQLLEKDGSILTFMDVSGYGLLLRSIEDPNGNRITCTYSGGRLTNVTHSAGPSFTLEYTPQGRLFRLIDHAEQVTTYQYDASGEHLLHVTAPGMVLTDYTYESAPGSASDHALKSVTFPDLTHQFFAWDSRGRVAEQSRDGGAERLQFTYDASGTVTICDARNAVTTLRLGSNGQLLQMVDALGRPVTFGYDAESNLTRLTGPAGETTELGYDTAGNASSIVNPLGQTVALKHAALGRLSKLSDARNQSTDFQYDPQGNLTGIAYPDASAETFGYDGTGSVTSWKNRRGQTVQFTRNASGQPTKKTYPDGRTIDYEYDTRGQLTQVTDSVQGVTHLGYDARGFLTTITYPDGKGFTFEYNAAGRRTRRTGTDGYILNYGYDAAGRLETLTDGNNDLMVRYAYDPAGRLQRETKGNGTYTTYSYDLAGQVLEVTNHAPDGTVQSFYRYTYDAKGNRLTMTTLVGVTHYEYDALNQLIGVTYPDNRHVTYEYDAAGNRKTVNDNGANTTYTANSLNQYTQAGPTSFQYDTDGNMTGKSDTAGTTTYQYDVENRLVRVETPAEGIFEYTYDALGNRTAVTHDGVTSRYLHDPIGLVDVAAEYDNSGTLVARYDHGLGLVARTDGSGNEAFYSFDALGNTRELTDGSGQVVNEYDYDAFGRVTLSSAAIPNDYKFGARLGVADGGQELVFKNAANYDPISGRTLSARELGGTNVLETPVYSSANNPSKLLDVFKQGMSNTLLQAEGIVGIAESLKNPVEMFKGIYSLVTGWQNQMWLANGDEFQSSGGFGEDLGSLIAAYTGNPTWMNIGKLGDSLSDWYSEVTDPAQGIGRSLTVLSYLFNGSSGQFVLILGMCA
jgi:YD repeat-containing protein